MAENSSVTYLPMVEVELLVRYIPVPAKQTGAPVEALVPGSCHRRRVERFQVPIGKQVAGPSLRGKGCDLTRN